MLSKCIYRQARQSYCGGSGIIEVAAGGGGVIQVGPGGVGVVQVSAGVGCVAEEGEGEGALAFLLAVLIVRGTGGGRGQLLNF